MSKLKVLDLFSGIGGFSLGLESTGGFETVAFCEKDKKCHEVLHKHWPEIAISNNVETLNINSINQLKNLYDRTHMSSFNVSFPPRFRKIDVVTGGFPCQDISVGGKQKGIKGERSGLWKEMFRIIGEVRPKYAIIENVERLRKKGLGVVLRDLSEIGYDAEWHCITARSVGYPHQRDRLFIIAYPSGERLDECVGEERHVQVDEKRKSQALHSQGEQCESESEPICPILSGWSFERIRSSYPDESPIVSAVCRVTNGIPSKLDEKQRKQRIKQLGNSIVPRIAEIIGKAILERETK